MDDAKAARMERFRNPVVCVVWGIGFAVVSILANAYLLQRETDSEPKSLSADELQVQADLNQRAIDEFGLEASLQRIADETETPLKLSDSFVLFAVRTQDKTLIYEFEIETKDSTFWKGQVDAIKNRM
ncbi:MAG: hypothetical protein GY789_27555 [Hyphomicrobiales bacterium]|nr:hypothetical protein [Hyphomicrobiales bacterium]MCP4999306.1 hypothetical protein [Hyphomicrobiales bacterium]